VAFHPTRPRLAAADAGGMAVTVYEFRSEYLPPVEPAPPTPHKWVWVCGTEVVADELPKSHASLAQALGIELGARGFGLITGGRVGVEAAATVVFAGAVAGLGARLGDFLVHVTLSEPARPFGRVEQVQTEEQIVRRSIELADAVVVIGGLGSLQGIAQIALEARRPVFPLPATGGDARRIYDEIIDGWDRYTAWGVSREDFDRLGQAGDDLISFVVGLLEKVSARRTTELPSPAPPAEEDLYYFGGIDATTGAYLFPPMTAAQIVALAVHQFGSQDTDRFREPRNL
jgi:hypothetical protein